MNSIRTNQCPASSFTVARARTLATRARVLGVFTPNASVDVARATVACARVASRGAMRSSSRNCFFPGKKYPDSWSKEDQLSFFVRYVSSLQSCVMYQCARVVMRVVRCYTIHHDFRAAAAAAGSAARARNRGRSGGVSDV